MKQEIQCCITHCEIPLDQDYWNERWQKNETGWDTGMPSPAITTFMDQYPNKDAAILIPGCGNAHEVAYLLAHGFSHITLLDIAPQAVELLKEKFSGSPQVKVLCEDFFTHEGQYDLIIEQTFFCAIPPFRRKEYVEKAASLLRENGKIIGVLFDKEFNQPYPPFGGCACEYKPVFESHFLIRKMEKCYNSIPSRAETELFIHLDKQKPTP
jgi:SAM-dependent methyltransferase